MKFSLKKAKRGFSFLEIFVGISMLSITGVSLVYSVGNSARYAYKNFYDTLVNDFAISIYNQIISMPPSVLATYVDAASIPVYGAKPNPAVKTALPLYSTQNLGSTPFSIIVDDQRAISFPVSFLVSLEKTTATIAGVPVPFLRVSLTYEYMNTIKNKRTVAGTFCSTIAL